MMLLETDAILEPEAENTTEPVIALMALQAADK